MSGLDANPVLLSTKENGIAPFPNRSKFNYVIACVVLDGKQYLLDATDKYCTTNNIPLRALNQVGRLINKDGSSSEINLMPTFNSLHNLSAITTIDKEGLLSGQIREQYFDYEALRFREKYSGLAKESYLENKKKCILDWKLKSMKLKMIHKYMSQ